MRDQPLGGVWLPVLILVALVLLVYLAMWRGWVHRGARHELPPLVEPSAPDTTGDELAGGHAPADTPAELEADARYVGTTTAGAWLDRVVARGLGTRSPAHLVLTPQGLDVHRPAASFRIPAAALRGARHDQGLAGKVVPPYGLLVVSWRHGDLDLDSGFRLTEPLPGRSVTGTHEEWVQALDRLAKEHRW